jgi:phage-related protein
MNSDYSNLQGSNYETLMMRANKTRSNTKRGVNRYHMENLMNAEKGESFVSHFGTYKQQLKKVKEYLNNALFKLAYMEELSGFTIVLHQEKVKLDSASSTAEINSIIDRVLDITQTVKY